ncbi:MAG TPA: hypothetical protein DCM05_06815 [Elusimicrobia bacterium]|nr:hypothetical protein [Elusimicrobiota bacterium]
MRARALACLAAALFAGACVPSSESAKLRVQGAITAAPHLQRKAEQSDFVLLIVAMNAGGVPVAVRRVLHPKLPLDYALTEEDLVLPGPVRGPLTVKVHASTHGQAGITTHGDLGGAHPGPVDTEAREVNIVIDREF